VSWQDLAAERHDERLAADETWQAVEAAWVAAYAAAADLVASRSDMALTASASGGQWLTGDEWERIIDASGVADATNDAVLDGLVATAADIAVPLDDTTLMATVREFVSAALDAVDYLRHSIDEFHESALRRSWTADEFGRALRTSGASPLSAARATRFARSQASGALNAGVNAALHSCPYTGRIEFATQEPCAEIAAVRWVTQRDERVRPAHAATDTDTIPLGSTFTVGGYPARFPGDPNLPIGLRINCRCFLAWVDGSGVRRVVGATKAELYATARNLDIAGRSKMTKAELQSAILTELCMQGLAGGPDCPDVFDQMNRTALMTYARQENIVGRWRMTKRELIEQLRLSMRGGDRLRVAQGFAPAAEFGETQRRATRKRRLAAGLPVGDDQLPPLADRRQARNDVFTEFGGPDRGYVPCAFCGLKVNPDPTSGLAVLVPTPIRPFADGGTAALANMLPGCPACFQAHRTATSAALVASGTEPGAEQWDGDDIEMPDWVRERSERRVRDLLGDAADALFHLKGTQYDHDQSTHAGRRTLARMSPDERIDEVTGVYYDFRYEHNGETFRAVAKHRPGAINPDPFAPARPRDSGRRIEIEGLIVNGDGEPVGEFRREIFPWEDPPSVYNDTLAIEDDYQNRGIGSAFLDQTEAALANLGIDQAEVTAVSVGKYAWAARGYRLHPSEHPRVVRQWREVFDQIVGVQAPLSAAEQAAAEAVMDAWEANPDDVLPADLLVVSPKLKYVFRHGPACDGIRDLTDRRELAMAASAPATKGEP
jgi:GNAT superfamily N-acetyltransferase